MAQWLSWLERRPVTAEVESSSLFWVVMWGLSSAGRASALQAEGHRFEPCRPHLKNYGWIPEWPKGADCKSVGNAFEGSNPSPSICDWHVLSVYAGVAELADAQDLKSCGTYPPVPVRFRSPAFNCLTTHAGVVQW